MNIRYYLLAQTGRDLRHSVEETRDCCILPQDIDRWRETRIALSHLAGTLVLFRRGGSQLRTEETADVRILIRQAQYAPQLLRRGNSNKEYHGHARCSPFMRSTERSSYGSLSSSSKRRTLCVLVEFVVPVTRMAILGSNTIACSCTLRRQD